MNKNQYVLSVIGLGYVGLPMAVAFAKKYRVIGFDVNQHRIDELCSCHDHTGEVADDEFEGINILFTHKCEDLSAANFHIVAVPTPINEAKEPDFTCLEKASETVGAILKKGDIVVYESTVYPGATEEVCLPILEQCSGLKAGVDFFIGYSPERINPSDKEHVFTTIKKVVSAQSDEILEIIAAIYADVITAGVYCASSIKVAEAAKVIENTQRDLNIALINELALIFDRLGIDTLEVLEAAGTKWNFLPFRPGLVGGHCIGVDPYYLTYKSKMIGYHPDVILAGRRVNDNMGEYIATQTVKQLIHAGQAVKGAKVGILGLTFKENCGDLRNTRVIDIYRELTDYGIDVIVHDPLALPEEALDEYGIHLSDWDALHDLDAVVFAVAHDAFISRQSDIIKMLKTPNIIIDVKSVVDKTLLTKDDILWRL